MNREVPQILIAGAGPSGLTAAILLKLRGLNPIVVDRKASVISLPAAHVTNLRSMEIFREMGVANAVLAATKGVRWQGSITWCESLSGRQYGRLEGLIDEEAISKVCDYPYVHLAQNIVEPILLDRFLELGGTVRYGEEVTAASIHEKGVIVTIRAAGSGDFHQIHADWVLGCDGAGSNVRRASGIVMEGPRSLARFITIYFSADLFSYIKGQPGPLYWIGGSEVRGFFISFDFAKTWALLAPIGDAPIEAFSDAMAETLVRKAIGDLSAEMQLTGVSSWNMSAQVANTYRRGPVFLIGDACHRFPPTGGLGMNTGIQDAHNLVWKLKAVIDGEADDALLNTYETERRPVALRNTHHSVSNLMNMRIIDEALGVPVLAPVGPEAALGPIKVYPDEVLPLDGDTPEAMAYRTAVQAAINSQAAHFGAAVGIDLGMRYEEGALVSEGENYHDQQLTTYEPDARPGMRLPHFPLEVSGARRSTLELVEDTGTTLFALVDDWQQVAEEVSSSIGIPITPVIIGVTALGDREALAKLFGLDPRGAVLVRPDGHIAWRSKGMPDHAGQFLLQAVATIYSLSAAASQSSAA